MLAEKHFYGRENLAQFRAEYEQMPIQQKLMENTMLAGGLVLTVLLGVVAVLLSTGLL
jgi:restriction endonuclease Mrr